MKIKKKNKDKLDLAFNESKINHIEIETNLVEIMLDCISMNSKNEFPEDNRHKFIFKNFGRIAVSYRLGEWNDENAEIIKIESNELKSKFEGLKLNAMYGWKFINIGEKNFNDWKNKLSLDFVNNENWKKMNTFDLFAEQYGKNITIDIRLWFKDFTVFDYFGKELNIKEFMENGERGWNQLYKTGITTENHKTEKY